MVSLQKGFSEDALSVRSYEEIYKTAYSHGLESIYALENIDIKSVRPLQNASTSPSLQKKALPKPPIYASSYIPEFEFGPSWRRSIAPFFLQAPIEVLGLSKAAEKCLLDYQKTCLSDLLTVDLRGLIFLKGMGQSHLNEIKEKLSQYIGERDRQQTDRIDFKGWILSLTNHQIQRKKIFLLLESYQLSDLLSLSPMEAMEIRRLSAENRASWEKRSPE